MISQVQNHFFKSAEAILTLAAHLLVQTDQGGGELVMLLLEMGARGEKEVCCRKDRHALYSFAGWDRAGAEPDTSPSGRAQLPGAREPTSQTRGSSTLDCP